MDARQLSSNASTFSVGMMKLTRGGFSEPDGMGQLWLTARQIPISIAPVRRLRTLLGQP